MATESGSGREVPAFIKDKGPLPGFDGLKEHWHATSKGSKLHFYANADGVGPSDGPIMILAHGFPQTSYIFRYIIPQLQHKYRLFVPDHPGVAYSSDATSQDKLTLGTCYIEGLVSKYGKGVKVILGGHDRGARIMQRLATSKADFPDVEILAVWMLDIVPLVEQFTAFANPSAAMNYFHWSFFPAGLAVDMIMAYGGDKWLKTLFQRSIGSSEQSQRQMERDDGMAVSVAWYKLREVNEAAARDYTAAATEDYSLMVEDQKNGKKIEVPTLVLHGVGLTKMNDVQAVWPNYVKEGTKLSIESAGDGYGHYLAEECPDWTTERVLQFLQSVGL